MYKKYSLKIQTIIILIGLYIRKTISSIYISKIYDNTNLINKNSRLLILVIKDEAYRLDFFLEYYRKMGINHFLILSNQSVDNISEILLNHKDVSLFNVNQKYQKSRYGVDWINYIAHKYCLGKWVLTVDADEFLVYPDCEINDINFLIAYLESTNQNKLFCLLIDMYSKKTILETQYSKYESPFKTCPYFDKVGYFQKKSRHLDSYVIGGPRLRCFNQDNPIKSPALNKIPLVRWDYKMFYYLSTHVIYPKRMNVVYNDNIAITTGALLHFKFFNDLDAKVSYAIQNNNHYNNSEEYKLYAEKINNKESISLYSNSISEHYESSSTLINNHLIEIGEYY